jgi:hypothetical protein
MPALLALIVALHLLCDLAWPSIGAFRFNPYESIDGVRAEEVAADPADREREPAARPERGPWPVGELTLPSAPRRASSIARRVAFAPRRDLAAGDASARAADDH